MTILQMLSALDWCGKVIPGDFSALEVNLAGSGATWAAIDEYYQFNNDTQVSNVLKDLQKLQSKEYGDDPLFEAMERSKKLKTAGRDALKAICTAKGTRSNVEHPTNGPVKARDWQ